MTTPRLDLDDLLGADLPSGVVFVRSTDLFTQVSVPKGLLGDHRVAGNTWGRLVVESGALSFCLTDGKCARIGAGDTVLIPPDVPHRVELSGPVEFRVEFHAEPATDGDD